MPPAPRVKPASKKLAKVTLNNSTEKDAFYSWLWLSGTHMRNSESRPTSVDAALYKKFKKVSNEMKRRNAFLGGEDD